MDGRVFDLLGSLGLGGIFLGSVIEAMGIPFPGGIMLVLAGVLIQDGAMDYAGSLVMAVAGFNTGAGAAYLIGRILGDPFLRKIERFLKIAPGKVDRAKAWMEQSSAAFIIIGRFVPTASNLTPYLAGMSGLAPIRFLFYNSIFAIAWANFNLGIGYYFSRSWQVVVKYTGESLPYIAGSALIVYLAAALLLKNRIKMK